jgi:hypothetical protein
LFPGRELDENATPQFIGGTFMPPEEYDQLIEDPVKFFAEIILPRTCTNLETPRKAMATWVRLGSEYEKFSSVSRSIGSIAGSLGFPSIPQGEAYAPLDFTGISALPTITPIENIHALIGAAEKYGKY